MDLSIIIVSYNSREFLQNCLESLYRTTDGLRKEIILVDNCSNDDSIALVKSSFPQVKIIANDVNYGFAKANNIGAQAATGEYLLFLNPDTIVRETAIKEMIVSMQREHEAGAVGAKLLNSDGSLQLSCREFYTLRTIILSRTPLKHVARLGRFLRLNMMADWDHNETRTVDWVLGACLMTTRQVMEKIGYFDDRYRLYFEDMDLCYRIRNAGYCVYYCPTSVVQHLYQRSSAGKFSRKTVWHIKSAIRFFHKFGWKI
ncbi:MAG: glycosyltransferase family 2 protein [bacterium]|nr:glycosyltransferase family 2 protein [bacterium]